MLLWACIAALLVLFLVIAKARWNKISSATNVHLPSVDGRQISIKTRGWTQPEINKILADFCESYRLAKDAIKAESTSQDITRLSFPSGLPADLLLYLVNYIHYPRSLDVQNRTIAVACDVTLTEAFGLPEPDLIGRRATIYVPVDDREYDEVYASVEAKGAFRISFTDLWWHAEADPRMPLSVMALSSAPEG